MCHGLDGRDSDATRDQHGAAPVGMQAEVIRGQATVKRPAEREVGMDRQ